MHTLLLNQSIKTKRLIKCYIDIFDTVEIYWLIIFFIMINILINSCRKNTYTVCVTEQYYL